MLRNLLILPDGTELSSGTGTVNAIKTTKLTSCVNSCEELTLGSVCASMVEVTVITPNKGLSLTAGDEVTLYKVDDMGTCHKVGLFTLEKPTRPSANLMKLTGYDRVAKLDKDLTAWLKGLTGWPYRLLTFARLVCEACGLTLATASIPNEDFEVQQFAKETTGRQLMSWIGEACCRFCRANADGEIELAWYTPAGVSITPSGDHYYFQKGLTYEDYQVAPIDAVQLKLADSDSGYLWPEATPGVNSYIISGNPLLNRVATDMAPVLQVIEAELAGITYTPCKVSIPATLDISAGNTVQITDKNGVTITAYVMTKTQRGQRDTLECTGSPRRDSSTAQSNKSVAQIAQQKAAEETGKLDQLELLKRLTKEWVDDGIYLTDDGKLAVNASAILTGVLKASLIDADNLKIKAANITGKLTASQIDAADLKVSAANITGTLTIGQLPDNVATTDKLLTETGVVTIVKGTVNADYVNALGIKVAAADITGKLTASQIDATNLKVSAANITGTLTANSILVKDASGNPLLSAGGNAVSIGGWSVDSNSLFSGSDFDSAECFFCTGSYGYQSIGGSPSLEGWVIKAGSRFGVTKTGALYASNARISGSIYASGGSVGPFTINSAGMWYGDADGSDGGCGFGSHYLATSVGSGWRYIEWGHIHNCVYDWMTNSSSDIAVKNSVSSIDGYDVLFDRLKPCRYKYNYGTSDRYHTGFIAQEVIEAVESAGLTTQDFAGVVRLEEPNEYGSQWLLRRDEFVALNTWQIQKLKERVAALEALVGA